MYGGGPERRGGGDRSIETRCCACCDEERIGTITQDIETAAGATTEAAFVSVACSSNRGPDCLQQSEALSFIGHWAWPFLQQAIC